MNKNQTQPAWVKCGCGEFWCNIHQTHAWECDCPPIEEWKVDPYQSTGASAPIGEHMSKQTEALKLAEDALKRVRTQDMELVQLSMIALAAIQEALAEQPAQRQEPYGWHTEDHLTDRSATTYSKDVADRWKSKGWPVTPFYTSPPAQRTWVSLTDEDIEFLRHELVIGRNDIKAIEAKLKEKNA